MSGKIIGNTVGTTSPKSNLMQTDPTKGDYVKGKEGFIEQITDVIDERIDAVNVELDHTVKSINGVTPDENGNVEVVLPEGADGKDGYSPSVKIIQNENGAEITFTDKDGTTTAAIVNGKDGEVGPQGEPGPKGDPGEKGDPGQDAISPTVAVGGIDGGHRITITDKDGAKTFDVMNGKDAEGGSGISSTAIIDVTALPTENIDENKFYRLLSGSPVINQMTQNTYTVYCVDTLPESGEPATNLDQTQGWVYYNVSDGNVYGYVNDMLSAGLGVPAGWYEGSILLGALGFSYAGTITDITDDPNDGSFRLLLQHVLYSYKEGKWTSQKTIGWAGIGPSAEVFNDPSNIASGERSHAEGNYTHAAGYGSHAEGDHSHAEGNSSHAEGNSSHAEGSASHAEGYSSHAAGYFSHAEGCYTHAEGSASHAEGCYTHAEGYSSHAEGCYSHAAGYASHAEGNGSHAAGLAQHVQGENNVTDPQYDPNRPNDRAKYAHIVGNGTDDDHRSNAHTLDWNGLGWFAGGLKVGGTGQDDPNAVSVLTQADMDTIAASVIASLPIYNGEVE